VLTYPEFFKKARQAYSQDNKPALADFYKSGLYKVSHDHSEGFMKATESVAAHVGDFFDHSKPKKGELATNFADIFSLEGLPALANEIVPDLEENFFGCHLFVDKVYSYRSHLAERRASWLWHWDNNPNEVVKIIVYLSDVNDEHDGPFEYIASEEGEAPIVTPSRTGHDNWKPPRNGSRVSDKEMQAYKSQGYFPTIATGLAGTTVAFNNNCVHRANPPGKGRHRDIITLRVRPTIEKVESYIDERWTTTCEVSGACPKDPSKKK
jgi:hypothetical protein